jgi:hypothetical protein
MFNKKKYSCCFCSNKNETSNKKVFFCNDCRKVHTFIREYGIKTILEFIKPKASAPPY